MNIWILLGLVIGVWAMLNIVGGEQVRRSKEHEEKIKKLRRPEPPAPTDPAVTTVS